MDKYCFANWRLSSSVVVCNAAGMRAGWPPSAWTVSERVGIGRPTHYTVGQYGYVSLGRHFV